jgi:hypothetical protein
MENNLATNENWRQGFTDGATWAEKANEEKLRRLCVTLRDYHAALVPSVPGLSPAQIATIANQVITALPNPGCPVRLTIEAQTLTQGSTRDAAREAVGDYMRGIIAAVTEAGTNRGFYQPNAN